MAGLFHDDGCVIGNVPVRPFTVMFEPVCGHTKIRGAVLEIQAESAEAALAYATRWIRLPQLTAVLAVDAGPVTAEAVADDIAVMVTGGLTAEDACRRLAHLAGTHGRVSVATVVAGARLYRGRQSAGGSGA